MKALVAAAFAAAFASCAPLAAQAQPASRAGAYADLGYVHVDVRGANYEALQGRIGYRFNSWVAVEGEAGTGVKGEAFANPSGPTYRQKLSHVFAGYVVAFAPVGANTDLLARVGYSAAKYRLRGPGLDASLPDHNLSLGLGAQHRFDGVNGVRIDYTRQDSANGFLGEDDNRPTNTFSIAFTHRF